MVVVTLGQQYNIGEKPIVIRYTYINRHAGTPEKQRKQKHCSTSSNMVVIIYCYMIGCAVKTKSQLYIYNMVLQQYTVNKSGKYIWYGLRIEARTERTMM